LTATVRAAGPLPSVVSALKAAEERKAALQRTLSEPTPANPMNVARLQELIDDWCAMFRDNVAITRQILAQLLDGERVVFTQQYGSGWDFVAPCTLDRM
jgi:hypothetical protein